MINKMTGKQSTKLIKMPKAPVPGIRAAWMDLFNAEYALLRFALTHNPKVPEDKQAIKPFIATYLAAKEIYHQADARRQNRRKIQNKSQTH